MPAAARGSEDDRADETSGLRASSRAAVFVRSARPLWIERAGVDPVQLLCFDGSSATLHAGRYAVRTGEDHGAIDVAPGTAYELAVRPSSSSLRAAGALVAATGIATCALASLGWRVGLSVAWLAPPAMLVAAGAWLLWRGRAVFQLRVRQA